MNLKQILIVSIILTILTIGAVSASDDLISDDNLTVNNEDDSIVDIDESTENDLVSADDENIISKTVYEDENLYVNIYHTKITINSDYEDIFCYISCDSIEGNISLLMDNEEIYNNQIYGWLYIEDYMLIKENPSYGDHNLKINFKNETSEIELYNGEITIDYYMDIYCGRYEDDDYSDWVDFYDSWFYTVAVPRDANGNLYVRVDENAPEKLTYTSGKGTKKISVNGLSIGEHKIFASLTGDSKYPDKTIEHTFYVRPVINVPDYVSVGEDDFITVEFPQNYEGAVVIYNGTIDEVEYEDDDGYWHYDEIMIKDKIIGSSNVVNGFVKIPIENLVLGRNTIFINCSGSSGNYEDYFYIRLIENSPRFSSNINSNVIEVGEDIILTITAPRLSESLLIYVDGKTYKEVYLDKTAITEYITKLSIGEHHIKLTYSDYGYWDEDFSYDDCYSVSYYVTVKDKNVQPTPAPSPAPAPAKTVTKLTLKKVKVKKSAKKLAITATLKINGKAVKGKIIKFKFNKKSYKAKTNAKGVAKITVKKAVLKKLKVGKKVTYTATYGKITKKVTVKVKK